ncbi:alpha/beta fold hydrolase [Curtobacterium flaccumfaciens]|uniref:Alpha/beta fold hydrolase n=1 Tax=Curtobacterium poinsettiae TaxID=159612 RepID=A0A9Q9P5V5_9MICO|nr:alpha/beta fold hydrolase [Curtobacterium flaccumfaciens]UXN24496.1 alpha/beta fold hydrolase [Curtobacterium flaccumfaciens]UYC79332.1 alpha/beta fold hydrolase [Curtobacterium flaccumfaciens pv. poinsettiae]
MAADPLAGDPGAIAKLSSALADHQDDIRTGVHHVIGAQHDADGWRGASKDRFAATVGTVAPAAQRIIGRLDAAIDVLDTYADAVQQIQDEAERIQSAQLRNAVDSVTNAASMGSAESAASGSDATEADSRRLDRLQSDADDLAAAAKRLDAEWDALVERRAAADRAAAAGLSDSDVLGVAPGYAGSLAAMSDADFLRAVAGMPPEVLAGQGKGVADRIASMPPDVVQAWWDGLGGRGTAGEHSTAQDALITALPAVIGNLNGVPYWARDQANRLSAQRAYEQATEALGKAQKAYGKAVGRAALADARRALIAAQERYNQLNNFAAGARTDLNLRYPLPRQMVAFRDGKPPLGAFSVGDLDSASSVTFLVPGMGSSLADTTQYMRTGSTVQQSQQQMSGDASAYVTWLGYEAPPNFVATGDTAVFHEDSARAGAANLAADLAAVRTTRPDVQLNVVAHSYGSTTAAIALAHDAALRVHSFVTLGSAGIPSSVPDAAATNAAHMYAAQADEKWDIAAFGRTFSDPHRADPAQAFGATEIHTDGSKTVNVHDLAADPDSGNIGYLDSGTKTLLGTAKATMP